MASRFWQPEFSKQSILSQEMSRESSKTIGAASRHLKPSLGRAGTLEVMTGTMHHLIKLGEVKD